MFEPFQYVFFWQALAAAVLVLGSASLASFSVISNKQSFFTHGMSQSMVLGVAAGAGTIAGGLVGAVLSALVAASFIYALRKIAWLPQDASIAIVSSVFFAMGVIILNTADNRSLSVSNLLFGNILGVTGFELALLLLIATASAAFFGLWGNSLQFISQNPKAAQAAGLNVPAMEIARILMLALLAAVAIPVVGVLLVVAATTMPAVIGATWTTHYRWSLPVALVAGTVSATAGLLVSYFADLPTGPTIVIILAGLWVVSMVKTYSYRALTNRRKTPQT